MSWLDRLKEKWGLESMLQVMMVLIVFACTGFTVLLIKKPIVNFITGGEPSTTFTVFYWLMIFPIYNVILLFYGSVFGQFQFFWAYEKRMINRFKRRKRDDAPAAGGN